MVKEGCSNGKERRGDPRVGQVESGCSSDLYWVVGQVVRSKYLEW